MTRQVLGWSLVLAGAVAGCTTTVDGGSEAGGGIQDPDGTPFTPPGGDGGGESSGSGSTTAGTGGALSSSGPGTPGPAPACPAHAMTFVLRLNGQEFVRFDPVTTAVTPISSPHCGVSSLAMGRDGTWYTAGGNGVRSVTQLTCDAVSDLSTVGAPFTTSLSNVGIARDAGTGPEETLWVTTNEVDGFPASHLASVDMTTGAATTVGVVGDGEFNEIALAGTADGRLIGLASSLESTWIIDIDRTDGSLRSRELFDWEAIDPLARTGDIAAWGDAVYVFLGTPSVDGDYSTVVRHVLDGSAPDAVVATIPGAVTAAASTPCDAVAAE